MSHRRNFSAPCFRYAKFIIITALFTLVCSTVCAREIPALSGPVNDLAGIMTASERDELTNYLLNVDNQSAAQIAVLTVPSLEGDDIESFSLRVVEKWKLGERGTDLGVLIVVAFAEREMRIETGYGAEAELTDAKCGIIIRNIMAPAFRNNNYGQGIIAASKMISELLTGSGEAQTQFAQVEADGGKAQMNAGFGVGLLFFVIYIILILHFSFRFPRRRRSVGPFISPMGFPSSGGIRSGGSSFSSGGFGSSGSSFSSGGFSGGGGGFGGGGASGKW